MNYVPIKVLSNTTSTKFFDTLLSMFVANIDGKPYITYDSGTNSIKITVLSIPNPGLLMSRLDTLINIMSLGAIGSYLNSKSTKNRQNITLLASCNY